MADTENMPPTLSTAAADVKKKMPASIAGKPTAKKAELSYIEK